MVRALNRLTARKVQTLTTPGRHADGGGLYLVVDPSGARRWVMLYRFAGKRREMGLGAVNAVPLAHARDLAAAARAKIAARIDPLEDRKTDQLRVAAVTFADVATTYMADREKTWRSPIHRRQWRQTLETQAAAIWNMPIAKIETDDVVGVLRPLWHTKPETARRIRGRLEKVLDAARVGGHRGFENPARWRGHLEVLLPRSKKLSRGHHPAMPYADVPALYADLVGRNAPAARALRFIILTAARSGEVRGMTRQEIDFANAIWAVPKDRMKAGRLHRVPLTGAMIKVLPNDNGSTDLNALVFPSLSGRKMSDMIFAALLRRMGHNGITTHGFRSSFRDWVDAETDFAGDLAEAALAHLVGDETERAYRRGDALEKRRHLMEAWSRFVTSIAVAPSSTRVSSS